MKINYWLGFLVILSSLNFTSFAQEQYRTKKLFNNDWKFSLEADSSSILPSYNDKDWRTLNLPHDWSIEGEFKAENPSGTHGAFLPGGIGWYRNNIEIKSINKDLNYAIHFDGVYLNSDVWINGTHLGFYPNGYLGFTYDLTPYLKEGNNTITVRVDHSKLPSGRWYTGSGIYRNVWIETYHKVAVAENGTFVTTPEVSEKKASVKVKTELLNTYAKHQKVSLVSSIVDQNGKEVASQTQSFKMGKETTSESLFDIEKPNLWSPDFPNLYQLVTEVKIKGKTVDTYNTTFGIRELEWIPNKGIYLNGQPILMKGLSNHQDAGPVGVAVPQDVWHRRLTMLKEMGCNALRTAHHPFAPEFYAMCDSMGFMVMDEAFDGWWKPKAEFDFGIYFEDYWKQHLESFVKRDRNHPSIVIWSVGNEVPKFTNEEQEKLVTELKKHDTTRPVSQGRGYKGTFIDIAGFNGHGEMRNVLEDYHKQHPDQLIIGTEITHTLQTRGIYRTKTWYRTKDNPAPWEKPSQFKSLEPKVYKIPDLSEEEVFTGISKKYQSSYDNSIVRIGVRDDWNRVEEMDYYVGNFRWTGFDYLGESFNWPARTANFGIIDLAGFPKDHYYLYQSLWSDKPMVHLLPHWTHTGKEGVEIPMVAYTNCEEAELFLNGKSLGKKAMDKTHQIVWLVPYEVGSIKVIAYTDGKKMAEKKYYSASEAKAIDIQVDKLTLEANSSDVAHCEINIVDENGHFVPNADNELFFKVEGAGQLLASENGDILDMSSSKHSLTRKAFNGKCLLMVQPSKEKGVIKVTVSGKGLTPKTIKINCNKSVL
ncbi:DUF4982 domain-containing protein [Flammeovirga sp. MY04]|nr:glycoside hydrolase family 2 TIM barrel-domain containing protein [Flammeovirga sp. MY04]ANQ52448.1 DUF4982 domain-containing protein [Flammeovirga sp. MY04]